MEKKNLRVTLTGLFAGAALVASLGMAGCAQQGGGDATAPTEEPAATEAPAADATAAAPGEAAGFTEVTIENADGDMLDGIDVGNGFMEVSGVYFQPVSMSPGQESTEGFDLHLEADVAAGDAAAAIGYEPGTWIPYMTVDYVVYPAGSNFEGDPVVEGSFMEMNASDGCHYGANIKLAEGTYDIKFVFHNPAENGYLIHSDAETGPGGVLDDVFGNGPLELTFTGWEFQKQGW